MKHLPMEIPLNDEQVAQQIDVARRLIAMASLGVPTIEPVQDDRQAMLALHALMTAYLAMASTKPALLSTTSRFAFDVGHELQMLAEQQRKEQPNQASTPQI